MRNPVYQAIKICAAMIALCGICPSASVGQTWLDNTTNTSNNDQAQVIRRSDHFRVIWGKQPMSGIRLTEDFIQSNLQNLEYIWKLYHTAPPYGIAFHSPSVLNPPDGNHYRDNLYIMNTHGVDGEGFAYGWSDERSLGEFSICAEGLNPLDPPTSVASHEYGHGCVISAGGINNSSGAWHEGTANWLSLQAAGDFDAGIATDASWMPLPHGRDYYGNYLFLETVREDPLLGPAFINTFFETGQADYIFNSMAKQVTFTPDGYNAIKNVLGTMAAKCVTFDYQRGEGFRANDSKNPRYRYAYLQKQPGGSSWYRCPWELAPSEGGFNIVRLSTPDKTGDSYTVSCSFQGVWDSTRGSDWRVCFVAVNSNNEPRYSSMWNCGTNSITLSADENELYLVVAATPDFKPISLDRDLYNNLDKAPQAYMVALSNAVPYELTNGGNPGSGWHQHSNGGGWVADSASVDSTAYVGSNARVSDYAQVRGSARIEDYATVGSSAQVRDNAVVSGHGCVWDSAQVYGNAKIRDWGIAQNSSKVYGNAKIIEHGRVIDNVIVCDNACVRGYGVWYGDCTLNGYAIADGDAADGSNLDHGISTGWSWGPNQTYNDALPDSGGLFCRYDFERWNPAYAMDTYGMCWGYLMGSPANAIIADDNRGIVLQLNGSNQYVELQRCTNDFTNTTIATWVKWSGGANDQRVFSFGDGINKYAYLTPKDTANGKAKFVISNNGVASEQTIIGTAAIPANTWTHVAVTLNGSTGTLYIDGAVSGSNSGLTIKLDQLNGANVLAGGNCNYLGRGNSGNYFAGYIDDFRIYSLAQANTVVSGIAAQFTDRNAGTAGNGGGTVSATPIISLDAANLAAGTVATWTNAGSLGGRFTSDGTNPQAGGTAGRPAVSFGGSDRLKASFNAPSGITGNHHYSTSIWAYNPGIDAEECMLSWAQRGTASRCMQFNYGNATGWGAVTHWDGADMGFDGGVPAGGMWHHICVTFDGATEKVYVDGKLNAQENKTLSIWSGQPVYLGCAYDPGPSPTLYFSGSLSKVQVYDAVLSAADVVTLYNRDRYPASDTAAPTPNPATWLIPPTSVSDSAITMSATKATDQSGVEYSFTCTAGGGHSSGWISSNQYTDCGLSAGTNYTYTVQTRDSRLNTGTASGPASATTPATDTSAPSPDPATWALRPAGVNDTSITMTALAPMSAGQQVQYKFTRYATPINSGWQSSPKWTDTGLTAGSTYSYTVQTRNVRGATGSVSAPASAIARDETPPTSPMPLNPWFTKPVVKTDSTLYMTARTATDPNGVQYYFHCVSGGGPDSGWVDRPSWRSPVVSDGTYVYQYKTRDASAQLNENPYRGDESFTVSTKNCYHAYTISQALSQPDDTLVKFVGDVTGVRANYYIITASDNSASIKVMPNTRDSATDPNMLNKTVEVKGGMWTYSALGRTVTYASVEEPKTTGGNPLISIDATGLPLGSVASWTNSGALGGAFKSDGTAPVVQDIAGRRCANFTGQITRLTDGTGTAINAPSSLVSNAIYTISAWLYRPFTNTEAGYLSWAPFFNGANFNYYDNPDIGVADHWGAGPNVGWTNGIAPIAGQWHHIAVVCDGSSETVYADGVVNNIVYCDPKNYTNAYNKYPILLGSQQWMTGSDSTVTYGRYLNGGIAKLEVWDYAKSAAEIAQAAQSGACSLYYAFDESTGTTAVDSSGNARNGTLVNGPAWATGKLDNSISLDGVNDYVSVPNIGTVNSFTIATWINPDTLSKSYNAIAQSSGSATGSVQLYITSGGALTLYVGGNNVSTQVAGKTFSSSDLGKWTHLAVTYDSAAKTAKFYINGAYDSTRTYTTANAGVLNGVWVGGWNGGSRYFDGKIDEFRIYDRALSGTEIAGLANVSSVSIGVAKRLSDNSLVKLTGKVVTHAPRTSAGVRSTDCFYVEETNRSAGIRVENGMAGSGNLNVNALTTFTGTVQTDSNTGERYVLLNAAPLTLTTSASSPLGMNARAIAEDPNAIGLLVRVAGRVAWIAPNKLSFGVSDGYRDSQGYEGVTVISQTGTPITNISVGDFVAVNGVIEKQANMVGPATNILLFESLTRLVP